MQRRVIFLLLIMSIVTIIAAGCTSTAQINTTPVPTSTPQNPPVTFVNATPNGTTSIPVSLPTTPVTAPTTLVTLSPTPVPILTTSGTSSTGGLSLSVGSTSEPTDENALANQLTISGIGSNFVANTTHYVPAYAGGTSLTCDQYQNGTLYIFGSVTSRSKYPLNVDLEVDIVGNQLYVDNSTLDDSISIQPFGTAVYQFSTPAIAYCSMVGRGNDDISITNVSIASTS